MQTQEKLSAAGPRPAADPDIGTLGRAPLTIIVIVLVAYAALSFYSDSRPAAVNLAAGLSLGPVVLVGLALAWRWAHPLFAALISVLTAVLLYRCWGDIRSHYQWGNLVQQAGAYGLVGLGFARSLSAGEVPLCTRLADKLHGPLTALEMTYTRKATVAWAVFYAALTLAIVVLFFIASQRLWSFFVNFATFGLIIAMFAVEHAIRRRLIPQSRRGSTLSALRQFLIG